MSPDLNTVEGLQQRLREVEAGRDSLNAELRRLRESRDVAIRIGQETLFGSRDAVAKVRATINHLKAKANATRPVMEDAA